jgi:hypothetical protein
MGHLIMPFLIVPALVLAGFLFAASVRAQSPAGKAIGNVPPAHVGGQVVGVTG